MMNFFRSVYFVLIFAAITLAVAIWYLSPFIGNDYWYPFDGILPRLIFIGIVWAIILAIGLFIFFRRRKREK